jgi:hypothetical protein
MRIRVQHAQHKDVVVNIINRSGPIIDGADGVHLEHGDNWISVDKWTRIKARLAFREAVRSGHLVEGEQRRVEFEPDVGGRTGGVQLVDLDEEPNPPKAAPPRGRKV